MTGPRPGLLVALLALLAACGGKTENDSSSTAGGTGATSATGGAGASGGSGATGGSGASGGSGGSAAGGAPSDCAPGAACGQEGQTCTPPGCCQCTYICKSGTWEPGECPNCPPPSCPTTLPNDGDPCDPCANPVGQPCKYASCGPQASCDGQHWHIVIATCPPAQPCDATTGACPSGELCVHPGGLGDQPMCEPNPCSVYEPVSCACAGSLCTYGYCASATVSAVYCACPNC